MDVIAGLDMMVQRGQWDKAIETAEQQVWRHYILLCCYGVLCRYGNKLCLCYVALRFCCLHLVIVCKYKWCLAVAAVFCLDCTMLRYMTILLCDNTLCCWTFCHVTLHHFFIRATKFSVNTLPYTLLIWSKMVTRWKPWTCSVDTVLQLILR